MRFVLFGLLIVAFSLVSFQLIESKDQGIEFESITFEQALLKAKKNNKLIFIDAYTEWCGPCKWMAKNSFMDNQVGQIYNLNFINVKFDMEKGEGPEFAKLYSIKAYPTLLFVNGEGEVVKRVLGAQQSESLIKLAEELK